MFGIEPETSLLISCGKPTHIGVKGSNRRPFILILDSILVYATSNVNEFVSISELMQSKKDKRTPRILETDFYSVYLTHQSWHFFITCYI